MLEIDPSVKDNIIFSDEATFHVSGRVNRHAAVYWATENPHVVRSYTKNSPKINVWCGVSSKRIFGPYFFQNNINGANYLEMLEEFVDEIPLGMAERCYFQQDGAPAHYARPVKDFLDMQFPGRWIGRGGPIDWPPYSPDLTPLDFWLWGMLKNVVYSSPISNIEELKLKIHEATSSIPADMCERVINAAFRRFEVCAENGGAQVEHL
jgi:transposase